jgi:hypothetical protein
LFLSQGISTGQNQNTPALAISSSAMKPALEEKTRIKDLITPAGKFNANNTMTDTY